MGYYEFPHTRNYDQDLGFLINVYNDLKDTYNTISSEISDILLKALADGTLVKTIDKYIDNKFKPYAQDVNKQIQDIEKTVTTPFNFKGSVATKEDLPSSGNKVNDTYYVTSLKYRMTWNGSAWFQSSQTEEQYMDEYETVVTSLGGVTAQLSTEGSSTNHIKLLEAIEEAHTKGTFVRIPVGDYVFTNSVEIPDNYCVQIYGVMDGYSASMNRQKVGDENHPIHQGTYLMYRGSGRLFTTNVNVILHLKNLMITNENSDLSYRRDGRLCGQTEVSHGKKGKVYIENCYVGGFKNCHGRENITVDEQCCVLASRVRYSQNTYTVCNCVDSRFIDCSFNNNYSDFFLINNCGATTISNCRLEWSKNINFWIYYNSTVHDIILNTCEFDNPYIQHILIQNNSCENILINNNIFRRGNRITNPVYYQYGTIYYEATNNNNITFSNNMTVYKNAIDDKPQEDFKPDYIINIRSSANLKTTNNLVFYNNNWTGCKHPDAFTDRMKLNSNCYTNPETEMFAKLGIDIPNYVTPTVSDDTLTSDNGSSI